MDWYSYGAREYDPQIGRFFTQDRFADKYSSISPYQYAANDPINHIDINGDSIWVSYNKEKEIHTLHFTGKVLNLSGKEGLDVNKFQKMFKEAWAKSGSKVELDINFTEASSVDDITSSDHVIAQVDDISDANGLSKLGGKVSFVESQGIGLSKESVLQSAVHEGAHLLGIQDSHSTNDPKYSDDSPNNMMTYPTRYFGLYTDDNRDRFAKWQIGLATNKAISDRQKGTNFLNKGSNTTILGARGSNSRSTPFIPWRGNMSKGARIILPINQKK